VLEQADRSYYIEMEKSGLESSLSHLDQRYYLMSDVKFIGKIAATAMATQQSQS
jgi:hypothetical protein